MRTAALLLALLTGVLFSIAPATLARAEETKTCPRCKHRFVIGLEGTRHRGKAKANCRVCEVNLGYWNWMDFEFLHSTKAENPTLEETQVAWDAWRAQLREVGYDIGTFDEPHEPRLLPLETTAALRLALFDEAQRFRRRATWSRRMAEAMKSGRGTWSRAARGEPKITREAFNDLIEAWEERSALYTHLADRYRTLARDPAGDALVGPIPEPWSEAEVPELEPTPGLSRVVLELRKGLRDLLPYERAAAKRLLAVTRGDLGAVAPNSAFFERCQALQGDAFSTAIVTNLHPRRTYELDILRSDLLMDGRLVDFFARAPVLAEALKRHAADDSP